MASPILGVLGQNKPGAAASVAIYTVPATRCAVISTVAACETGAVDAKIRINIDATGAAAAAGNAITWDTYMPANNHYGYTEGIALQAGAKLYVYSDTGNVTFTVFGEETDIPA